MWTERTDSRRNWYKIMTQVVVRNFHRLMFDDRNAQSVGATYWGRLRSLERTSKHHSADFWINNKMQLEDETMRSQLKRARRLNAESKLYRLKSQAGQIISSDCACCGFPHQNIAKSVSFEMVWDFMEKQFETVKLQRCCWDFLGKPETVGDNICKYTLVMSFRSSKFQFEDFRQERWCTFWFTVVRLS